MGSHQHELEQLLLPPQQERTKEVSAFSNSSVWSKLTFSWVDPLFRIGRNQLLELADVPLVPESETAEMATELLEESLWKQKTNAFSLPNAIFCTMRKSLLGNAFLALANTIASYIGPLLITSFVDFLSRKSDATGYRYGVILAVIFFLAKCIESLTQRQWYFGAARIGLKVRAATISLAYKKSLDLKLVDSRQGSGKIINLINVDAEKLGDFFLHIHGIWLFPLQVFFALVILYINLGLAPAFAAFFSTVLVVICNTPLAKRQKSLNSKIMEAKDSRIKATLETLKNIRVLKLHSWESNFMCKLLNLREIEKSWLSKYLYTCSAVAFLFWASPTLVSVVTFGVCIWVKTPLTSGTALSALATFRILQEPIYNLPELISVIAQTRVSVSRVQNFIRDENLMTLSQQHKKGHTQYGSAHSIATDKHKRFSARSQSRPSDIAIDVDLGEYSCGTSDPNSQKSTIRINTQFKIKKGSKIAVCGPVGSGKSSLICSILGEIPRISGKEIKVFGTKAYVPQTAWIQTGTVRDNVLFGKDMDTAFYEEVIEACALSKDLEMWVGGDMCVVGERGITLSGGQKQRIQLARAIYSDADVYFLDDPFSAVDAHTCSHLFKASNLTSLFYPPNKSCLLEMLSGKTVVFITHQLEFLGLSDLVLVMKDGNVVQSGRFEDLVKDVDGELARQMNARQKSLTHVNNFSASQAEHEKKLSPCSVLQYNIPEKTTSNEDKMGARGRVHWHIYSSFVTAAYGGALVPIILLCQILFQGLQMGSSYWIAWATEEEGRVGKTQLLGYFVLLSGASCLFILGRTIFLSTIAIETAQQLFMNMIRAVFRAPLSFFDFTPSSRVLSRFSWLLNYLFNVPVSSSCVLLMQCSTDQSTVDTDIPYRLAGLVFALIQLLSIVLLMCHVAWQVFLIFIVVIAISLMYQAYYITSARELARMVGSQKAPILHHFSETTAGAPTIRCFNQKDRFYKKLLNLVNDYSRVSFHNTATMEWLSLRINFLFNVAFLVVLVILVSLPRSAIEPSLSGLVATYGLNMNVLQAWVIWNLCNVENKMISVERILEYAKIPSEAPLVIEERRPDPQWPSEGSIQFVNLHVRYSPALRMVLERITCTIPAKMKVGVVGRTGSGKSTLIQALFRVVEPADGNILIDGIDICRIGLDDLRSRLSIIPQDPTLFQGTVKANLDPLEQHSDQEIWKVVNKCHGLADIVKQDPRVLDAPVAEDGGNWSVGQRQLICLARVLLQRRRILVLDEATASVDTATDNLIQKTIREETSGCTVITVAHRIPTVIDNDLVLVLDQGKVIEYDSPIELLKDSSTAFSKLVNEFLLISNKSDQTSQ
ncbi:hypothetical protein Cgig2_027105 [Carnegiea gigantea]|uniref:ABC-type xenobiotic transporter n=1 Tax=Carnegiea gigantea TaxID=171969 RepID=A0A9Q1KA40_9CARY|nr:hypothetical protein Cgig2_027105 [Carnegiea gigantea]